jgi:TIR domain
MEDLLELIFIYARYDEKLLNPLQKHLSPLKSQGLISDWYDCEIVAGMDWEYEIDKHLNTASIILLLISPDFIVSSYCYGKEMKRALERHDAGEARVIPIILRPVIWRGAPFGRLQVLPKNAKPVTTWPNRDEAYFDIAIGIQKVLKEQKKN